jgi:hypothetical protein
VNTEVNLGVPLNIEKFLSNSATGGFSGRAQVHAVRILDTGQRTNVS